MNDNFKVKRLTMVAGRLTPHPNGAFVPIEEHEAAMELGLSALRAEMDVLRADADRYRWLRDVADAADWEYFGFQTTPDTTNAAIDAARAALKGEA